MIFVDEVRIFVKAGDGGKGCASFYRDKYTRYPRPNGGDGGKGGDVIFVADKRIHTLLDYRFQQHYVAARGGHGSSQKKKGQMGQDCLLKVPTGTILRDYETKLLIRDLVKEGEKVIVARGGEGGKGNAKNKTPTEPQKGEQRIVHLELKLIADVGIIGFPNAGKSTLISNISRVKSKIADYPFTTKQPILGIVKTEDFDFVVADLPGLIEGAYMGKGLGHRFLKHAERTKILLHLIDMGASEGRDPIADYEKIKEELQKFSDKLFLKQRIIVANKMDLPDAKKHLHRFKRKFADEVIEISALKKQGLNTLILKVKKLLMKEMSIKD